MALILPNSIDNDTPADAAELEQNFNVVETYVNTNVLHRDGSVAPTAPILLPGDPTQPNHAANKAYVDTQNATQNTAATAAAAAAAAATALKVSKAGDVMTGNLDVPGLSVTSTYVSTPRCLVSTAPAAANDATRKDYVDAQDIFYYNSSVSRMDSQDVAYYNAYTQYKLDKRGDTMSGNLNFNDLTAIVMGQKQANAASNIVGIYLPWWGSPNFTWGLNGGNLSLSHVDAADVNGGPYQTFNRYTSMIGQINQASESSVTYASTSHGPFKGEVADLDDDEAIERLKLWRPVSFRWKLDEDGFNSENGTPSGDVQHGFIAQELVEVQPSAVAVGHGTEAEHKAWLERKQAAADDGEEFMEMDPFMPWMTDNSKLVPDLVAAVQALIGRNADLTARIEALEAAA